MKTRMAALIALLIIGLALLFDLTHTNTDTEEVSGDDTAIHAAIAYNQAISQQRIQSTQTHQSIKEAPPPTTAADFNLFEPVQSVSLPDREPSPGFAWLEPSISINQIAATAKKTGRDQVFGWVELDSRGFEHEQLEAEWAEHGATVLDFNGTYARARLPNTRESLEALAAHPAIRGIGMQPAEEKISAMLTPASASVTSDVPVLISLMDDDPDGTWRSELEAIGAVVGDWFPLTRTYSANIQPAFVLDIADADFVSMIESVKVVRTLLDSAVTVMGADGLRTYDPSAGTFSGAIGASASVGFADSGLNIFHEDIASNRASVCGQNFVHDASGIEDLDLWSDHLGHGTHVAGIVAGAGSAKAELAGMAPGTGHLRMAKVVDRKGMGSTLTIARGVQYLLRETTCNWQDEEGAAVRPMIVNLGVGEESEGDGPSVVNSFINSTVQASGQLFVVPAGNSDEGGVTPLSTAKNSLSVGAITHAGQVAGFSSHGPTSSGRLAPHLVATGSTIRSAMGDGRSGYQSLRGTSVAAPFVSGVAALLLDQNSEFKNQSAHIKARLMSSAVKPASILGSKEFPLNNSAGPGAFNNEYGLGIVSAGVAVTDGPEQAWWHGGDQGTVTSGESLEYKINIPEDTARLDVVLTWSEPPAPSIRTSEVVADLDLYIDKDGDCGEVACGEYVSASRIDNVEWIILKAPEAGSYTIRIVATNDFADYVQAAVAWTAIANSDTPALDVSVKNAEIEVASGGSFEIEVEVTASSYVSSGTTLHMMCDSEEAAACDAYQEAAWRPKSEVYRADGTAFRIDTPVRDAIPLGEVRVGEVQRIKLVAPRNVASSSHTLYFVASAWNAQSAHAAVDVLVDGQFAGTRVEKPGNDAIANAIALSGESGNLPLNLKLATREPGEPMTRTEVFWPNRYFYHWQTSEPGDSMTKTDSATSQAKRFYTDAQVAESSYDLETQRYALHGSVWYSIDAARHGAYRLTVKSDNTSDDLAWRNRVSVYEGASPSAATRIAEDWGFAEFDAQPGNTYLVQVWATEGVRQPLTFGWNQREYSAPLNDDFAFRFELDGPDVYADGTNYRATLEHFEFYGHTATSSVWYRWSAPWTGNFELSFLGSDSPPNVTAVVFDGLDEESLRRVSTMTRQTGDRIAFQAKKGHEYQIAIVGFGEELILDYRFNLYALWNGFAPNVGALRSHADNDMIADATEITGASGSQPGTDLRWQPATVEPDEDSRTGTGTRWWQWQPPVDGSYVFRLEDDQYEQIAAFVGDSSDDMEFITSGSMIALDAVATRRYWLAVGFRSDAMFADFDDSVRDGSGFSWSAGALPANDVHANATALAGSSGKAQADHTYASSSVSEPGGTRGHSSLWWRWQATETGWQQFALEDWESAGLEKKAQQSILEVYRKNRDDSLDFIATSDHSFVINGRAEASLFAESGTECLIRVALRSTDLGDWARTTSFTWAPANAPAWQRYEGRIVEVGAMPGESEDAELIRPLSVEIEGETGLILVAAEEHILGFRETDDGTLARDLVIPYQTPEGIETDVQEGAALHWDANSSVLYLVQSDEIFAVRGLKSDARHLQRCSVTASEQELPTQVVTDSNSQNLYVVGDDTVEVYQRTAACEFELLQVLSQGRIRVPDVRADRIYDLINARSLTLSPSEHRAYVSSDRGISIFERETKGTLTLKETFFFEKLNNYWDWFRPSLVVAGEDILFLVSGIAPHVAAFRILEEPGEIELLAEAEPVYFETSEYADLYSHVARPKEYTTREDCAASSAQGVAGPAVDVFCNGRVFTARWDEAAGELYLSDWFQADQPDRFGNPLGAGLGALIPTRIAEHPKSNRNYVVGSEAVGTLHVFERASSIESDPYDE